MGVGGRSVRSCHLNKKLAEALNGDYPSGGSTVGRGLGLSMLHSVLM